MTNNQITEKEIYFLNVTQKLKSKLSIRSNRQLAFQLGISPGTFSNRKRVGSLPYKEIIALCHRHGISLDAIFPNTFCKPVANYETAAQQTQANNLETSNSAPLPNTGDDLKSPNGLTSKYQRALEICKLCQAVGEVSTFNYAAGMRFDSMLRQLYPHTPIEQLTLGQISAVSQRLADEL